MNTEDRIGKAYTHKALAVTNTKPGKDAWLPLRTPLSSLFVKDACTAPRLPTTRTNSNFLLRAHQKESAFMSVLCSGTGEPKGSVESETAERRFSAASVSPSFVPLFNNFRVVFGGTRDSRPCCSACDIRGSPETALHRIRAMSNATLPFLQNARVLASQSPKGRKPQQMQTAF